jgi:hypothetical protein
MSGNVFAQDCNEEILLRKQGIWKESSHSSGGITATDLAKEKKIVATLHKMIQSKYSPTGVNAQNNGGYNSPQPGVPVNDYIYSIIPLNFYCDGNNIKEVGETPTYFQIAVNFFPVEIYDTAQGDRALLEGFNVLSQMPKQKDGYYYFAEADMILGYGITGKCSSWLITYDGKLPWAYVTKKEFLVKRKRILSVQMAQDASQMKEVLSNIEIEKTYKEKEYKNDAEKLQKYMRMDYLPTKERYNKQIAELEETYKPAYNKIEKLLAMPAAELSEIAIVKMDPNDHLSYLFVTEDDRMGKVLIKPNPSYFNRKLSKSTPQFFSVYVVGNHKDPIAAKTMAGLVNAVDFTTLKNMLGK